MKFTLTFFSALVVQTSALAFAERDTGITLQARTCGDPATAVPLLRAYSAQGSDHFYTTSAADIQNAVDTGTYVAEGVAGKIFATQVLGTVPFYRLHSLAPITDHFYTKDAWERDQAVNDPGYTYEGIVGYVYPDAACGGLPFHRLYHTAPAEDHFYTMADWEVTFAEGGGYVYEKISAYIIPV
ncbi:hypothetical protein FPV67DRAFT_1451314 [Lyophyllum atratum]|nr:hypothetical protein FPV67DRAFT_1451314 [Lyophyllum atratum]